MTVSNYKVSNVVVDFGADPTGSADSTGKFQSALNTTFTNSNFDTALYIPGGTYKITSPLYWFDCTSPVIFGEGFRSSVLNFVPSTTGNSITSGIDGGTMTPCIYMNGISEALVEGIGIQGPGNDSTPAGPTICGVFMSQNGSHLYTGRNVFRHTAFDDLGFGVLANSSMNCDASNLWNCWFDHCAYAGLRLGGAAQIDWTITCGGMSNCAGSSTFDPLTSTAGDHNAAVAVDGGGLTSIGYMSFVSNKCDVCDNGTQAIGVVGGSSSSLVSIATIGNNISVTGLQYRPAGSLNGRMFDTTFNGTIHAVGCEYAPLANTGVGYIGQMGTNGRLILDALTVREQGGVGRIAGGASSKLYLRANNWSSVKNPALFTEFSGTKVYNPDGD